MGLRESEPDAEATSQKPIELHSGWRIDPMGVVIPVSDMPTLGAVSPDGKWILFGTTGYGAHELVAIPAHGPPSGPVGTDRSIDPANPIRLTLPKMWGSLRWVSDRRVVVSSGSQGVIWEVEFDPLLKSLKQGRSISVPPVEGRNAWVGSVEVMPDGSLWALDRSGVRDFDVAVHLDATGKELGRVSLTAETLATALSPDGKRLFVSDHERHVVHEIDTAEHRLLRTLPVGKQPNALVVRNGKLFVSESGDDTLGIVDLATGERTHTVRVGLTPKAPLGAIPNSVALSADGKRAFVSCGGANAVAVIGLDGERPKVQGFIPTGRYPTLALVGPSDQWLYVGVGKGFGPSPNFPSSGAGVVRRKVQPAVTGSTTSGSVAYDYILAKSAGGISRVPMLSSAGLALATRRVVEASPYRDSLLKSAQSRVKSALPKSADGKSPFKHVLYIIKENRTYDQVFGDMARGNGDPSLCIFGESITPNHHRLAREYVLLDNVYCDGEVSQDGWEWSTAALDSDWSLKDTYLAYGGRGGAPNERHTIRPMTGYLWEWAEAKGHSVYSYGAKTAGNLFSPTWKGQFSVAWNEARATSVPDYLKVDLFIRDLARAEETGKLPNLIVMSLTDDHTSGTRAGARTPSAFVASNDLALGKVVEAMTKSRFWPETAIFVIEDDAQDGPDHVDSHRTVALVISPYTKKGSYVSTKYTSTSMVRSIELALGISPKTQFDAAAAPMFECFTGKKELRPYASVVPKVDMQAVNPRNAPMAALSATLDFSDVDLADFATLNRILWAAMRPGKPYPGVVSSFR